MSKVDNVKIQAIVDIYNKMAPEVKVQAEHLLDFYLLLVRDFNKQYLEQSNNKE